MLVPFNLVKESASFHTVDGALLTTGTSYIHHHLPLLSAAGTHKSQLPAGCRQRSLTDAWWERLAAGKRGRYAVNYGYWRGWGNRFLQCALAYPSNGNAQTAEHYCMRCRFACKIWSHNAALEGWLCLCVRVCASR